MWNLEPAPPRTEGDVIEVRGLTFTYPGAAGPAVCGMDFTVGRGEIFGFLGPSGAGKSTTQKLLIGLLRGHGGNASYGVATRWTGDLTTTSASGCRSSCPTTTKSSPAWKTCGSSRRSTAARRPTRCRCWPPWGWPKTPVPVGQYSKGMQMRLTFARPDQQPRAAVPRRAHLGPGPSERPHGQGHDLGPEGAEAHRVFDHPRHGHRRRVVRPGRFRRRRNDRRPRHAGRVEDRP